MDGAGLVEKMYEEVQVGPAAVESSSAKGALPLFADEEGTIASRVTLSRKRQRDLEDEADAATPAWMRYSSKLESVAIHSEPMVRDDCKQQQRLMNPSAPSRSTRQRDSAPEPTVARPRKRINVDETALLFKGLGKF